MKKIKYKFFIILFLYGIGIQSYAQINNRVGWEKPKIVVPSEPVCLSAPPSDAIILFDGKDFSEFENLKGDGPVKWIIENGIATIPSNGGDIRTKRSFKDFQLHIEWRVPKDEQKEGSYKGNSGIYLQGKYEIQVLNSFNNITDPNVQAGSIYNQKPPLVNAMAEPGEWNIFDIVFTAPTFKNDSTYRSYPYVTVFHNGIIIQNHSLILGITYSDYQGYASGDGHGDGPIVLQDHQSAVSFRNIWIREL
jgi:hypothetical protein